MLNLLNIMIDLETTGTRAGCKILSLGACVFDREKIISEFYNKISVSSQDVYGLISDVDTMAWWSKQDALVSEEAFSGEDSLEFVLEQFVEWCPKSKGLLAWSCGADFDIPILNHALAVCKHGWITPFWNDRCYRTAKNIFKSVKPDARIGDHHNALDDARYQALHLLKIYGVIRS